MSQGDLNFDEIHDTFRARIHRYLTRLVGEPDAEDLTQEVFAKVGRSLDGFRGDSSVSTWVYRIATNTAVDRLRSSSFQRAAQEISFDEPIGEEPGENRVVDTSIREAPPSTEQEIVRKQMNDCIRDFIGRLPSGYRSALVLSEMEGLKNREIAEILGISLDAVKMRLHRAKEKLRQELVAHCDAYWLEGNEYAPDMSDVLRSF